jgi:PAS domain S-box-containing protein
MKKNVSLWIVLLPLGGICLVVTGWLWIVILNAGIIKDAWLVGAAVTLLLLILFNFAWIKIRSYQADLLRLEMTVSGRSVALARSEARYRILVENIKAGIVILGYPGFEVLFANQEFKFMLGINPKTDDAKLKIFDHLPPQFMDGAVDYLKRNPGKHAFEDMVQLSTRRGGILWSEVVYTPILLEDVSAVLLVVTDITDRRKSAETVQKRASELAALYAMSRSLAAEQDLTALLEEVADYAMTLLSASCAEILLYDESLDVLEVKVFRGFQGISGHKVSIGRGVGGRVAQSLQSMIVDDYEHFSDAQPEYLEIKTTSILGVPMVFGGELIGVLELFELAPSSRKFTKEESRLLDMFAAQAASAVHNTWLMNKTNHHMAELEVVAQVSSMMHSMQSIQEMLPLIVEDLLGLLKTTTAQICIYNGSRNKATASIARGWLVNVEKEIAVPASILNKVLDTGQRVLIRDFAVDPEIPTEIRQKIPGGWSGIIMRLVAAQEVQGVLFLAVPHPREITRGDTQVLDTLCEIAGGAIHRTYLFERTQQQLKRISALYDIDTVIRSSLDQSMILKILLEKVIVLLGVDAADILLCHPESKTLKFQDGLRFKSEPLEQIVLNIGQDIPGKAVREEKTIAVADLSTSKDADQRSQLLLNEGFTSCYCVPLISKGKVIGVLEVLNRTMLNPDSDWLEFLEAVAAQAAIALDNANLVENLQKSNKDLLQAYESAIEGWVSALDKRDTETEGHSQRVAKMTMDLARLMGIPENQLIHIYRGALLHDIGKIAVPDQILRKNGPLDADEWVIMRKHPQHAYDMLANQLFLQPALDIPYCHHEKWDGSGYPRQLAGESIPVAARIFAIIDVWDALRSDRPYRLAWDLEKTLAYIQDQSGKHFDPKFVDALLRFITQK